VLVNITGGNEMSLYEISEATTIIYEEAGEDANVIFGAVIDEDLNDEIFITVIATGFHSDERAVVRPPQTAAVEANPKVLDLPTFMRERKKKTEESAEAKSASQTKSDGVTFDGEIDDLDIPTFLRKQMD
jgi:cell division protein FtsZ